MCVSSSMFREPHGCFKTSEDIDITQPVERCEPGGQFPVEYLPLIVVNWLNGILKQTFHVWLHEIHMCTLSLACSLLGAPMGPFSVTIRKYPRLGCWTHSFWDWNMQAVMVAWERKGSHGETRSQASGTELSSQEAEEREPCSFIANDLPGELSQLLWALH